MKPKEDIQTVIKSEVVKIILQSIRDHLKKAGGGSRTEVSGETRLSGKGAFLDSLALVQLLIEIEERTGDRYGVTVALMDERAMSEKSSPFITVGSLANYLVSSIEKQRGQA